MDGVTGVAYHNIADFAWYLAMHDSTLFLEQKLLPVSQRVGQKWSRNDVQATDGVFSYPCECLRDAVYVDSINCGFRSYAPYKSRSSAASRSVN